MSESNEKYYRVAAIVDQFLINNDLTEHWFNKALSWALWGLRELSLDTMQEVKTCLLTVTDRKTVTLPRDFVDWVKVGVRKGQYCVTMGVNSDLTGLQRTGDDDRVRGLLSQNLPNGLDVNSYGGYYFFNYGGKMLLGLGGGFRTKGDFKVVKRDGCTELLLDYDYGYPDVYLEYISDGIDPCGETILHPYTADYVLKYIELWYEKKNNPKATESSIDRLSRDVFEAEMKIRGRTNDLDPKTLINISRSQTRLTAKI